MHGLLLSTSDGVGERRLRQLRNGNHSSWGRKALTLRELKHSRAPALFWIEKQEGKEITWAVPPGPCGTAEGTRRDVREDGLCDTQGWLTQGLSASWKLWNQKEKSNCRAELPCAERGGLSVAGSAHCGSGLWLPSDPFPGISPAHSSSHSAVSVILQQQGLLQHQTYLLLFLSRAIFQKQQIPNFENKGFYYIYPLAQVTWRFVWVISKKSWSCSLCNSIWGNCLN